MCIRDSDLSTSFDGASWKKPGEESWTLFWHVDHDARHPPNFRVYQSTVALSTIDDSSGGIQFASGSHLFHEQFMKMFDTERMYEGWEFVQIPEEVLTQFKFEKPSVNPGDMILWDSRCTHRVVSGDIGGERKVVYLCYVPRYFVSNATRKERKKAFRLGISSTHWPHRFLDRGAKRVPPSKEIQKDKLCVSLV